MAMASAGDLQALLRFLSQDAKVPLALAMGKVRDLREAKLTTPAEIAKSDIQSIQAVFQDEKVAKQVLNAAKRVSKKRAVSDDATEKPPSPAKKVKPYFGEPLSPAQLEASLALPEPCRDEEQLSAATIYTNRAPLVLAFAVTLLKYTMPEQPLSSRLSLSQAVVSANSRTKAVSIGLESGKSAEEEGWGEGQPIVTVMGREIRVMKRWGYDWAAKDEADATQETMKEEPSNSDQPALWGVDLEKLKQSNGPGAMPSRGSSGPQLPIYTAQSARAYLLKSFETPKSGSEQTASKKASGNASDKERNLALLLGALELLFESWSSVMCKDDLDKRAWGWYVRVRPEVESGVAGWGGKGIVKLADILELRRTAE
ncbi:uncharacterized protein EI97DRAFT_411373 [Westerdykella ornata]|uniref:Impact N-terminal domain-containing protein n=1 Tax=Westerdykella ornata TaxID=318751 RepID=A0A6A6JV47_WESOR|nr:uncharacterized protein EI97DRAFT_411373 [Westerdykella ornata]KAF2280257.1 hypothetical protein EI97DRAFT_411373 [Westerdykella ornata]